MRSWISQSLRQQGRGILMFLASWLVSGCTDMRLAHPGYASALEDGRTSIPYAKEFRALFPTAVEHLSHYTGTAGPPSWISVAGLYGRYVIAMHVPITFDETRTKVARYGDPEFVINEVIEVVPRSEHSGTRVSYGEQRRFGKKEWAQLVEAKGDLSVIGSKAVKDQPVEHFDEAVK